MTEPGGLEERLRSALQDGYRLERELGGGGMSRVFVAEEKALGRRVALKVLAPELGGGVSADRFRREIQTVANLQHPHIVPLLSAGSAAGSIYYTMPLVEGETLRARISREGRLRLRDALQLAREIAEALAYAHRHGVIHRDIKPENVLLTDGHAVVTDFGVAKALGASTEGGFTLTSAGLAIGTPAYMAPEQVTADPNADHRLDLYALGCVLYEMLGGRAPFGGSTLQEVLAAHVAKTAQPVTELRADVPADVAAWVFRALEKDPARRWATADDARAALDECLARLSGESRTEPAPAFWRRPKVLVAAVAAASAAGVAVMVARQGDSGPVDMRERIAVLPFTPTDPSDTALARLGRDLVVTLTANLDGVGDLHMIDPMAVLAQTQGGEARSPDRAMAIAQRLGARSGLLGTLVRSGNSVRLDYRLLSTQGGVGAPIAQGTVTAPLGDEGIVPLTDSATWGMLRAILPARGQQMPSIEVARTRSIPALRAFLDGERLMLANDWLEAEKAFDRAIAADSSFWFAYRRVSQAGAWIFRGRPQAAAIAEAHRASFPERERLIMESNDSGGFGEELARLKAITQRFPDFWDGWFRYADVLVHSGYRLGIPQSEAAAAFERVVEANPRMMPAYDHLLLWGQDSGRRAYAYAKLKEHYGAAWDSASSETGIAHSTWFGITESRLRTGRIDPVLIDRLSADIARGRLQPSLAQITMAIPLLDGDARSQLDLERNVRRRGMPPQYNTGMTRWRSTAWAMRGAWDSALVALDDAAQPAMALGLTVERYSLAVLAYWSGAVDESATHTRRVPLANWRDTSTQNTKAAATALAFLDGMVAYAARRAAGIDSARSRLRAIEGSVPAGYLERALAAFKLEMSGKRDDAADSLTSIEWQRSRELGWVAYPVPFIRLAAGRWRAAKGAHASADSLLSFYETADAAIVTDRMLRSPEALAVFERARAREAARDSTAAVRYYKRFLELYDMPPAAHRQYVTEAESALARLTGVGDRPKGRTK